MVCKFKLAHLLAHLLAPEAIFGANIFRRKCNNSLGLPRIREEGDLNFEF